MPGLTGSRHPLGGVGHTSPRPCPRPGSGFCTVIGRMITTVLAAVPDNLRGQNHRKSFDGWHARLPAVSRKTRPFNYPTCRTVDFSRWCVFFPRASPVCPSSHAHRRRPTLRTLSSHSTLGYFHAVLAVLESLRRQTPPASQDSNGSQHHAVLILHTVWYGLRWLIGFNLVQLGQSD